MTSTVFGRSNTEPHIAHKTNELLGLSIRRPREMLLCPLLRLTRVKSCNGPMVISKCCITPGGLSSLAWHFSSCSEFYRNWTDLWTGSTLCSSVCFSRESFTWPLQSPVSSCCSRVQILIKANFRDLKLMSPRVPLDMCSSRKQFAASTSYTELPFREDCPPTDCKVSQEVGQLQLLQILRPPPPSSHSSMLQVQRLLSLNCQMGTLKEVMCTVTEQAAATQTGAGKTHQLTAITEHRLHRNDPLHKSFYFSAVAAPLPWGKKKGLTAGFPCEGSDAQSSSHGRRFLLGWGTALLSQLFIGCGGHQLSNEYSLQTAIVNALSQPSPAGKPAMQAAKAQVSHTGSLAWSQS